MVFSVERSEMRYCSGVITFRLRMYSTSCGMISPSEGAEEEEEEEGTSAVVVVEEFKVEFEVEFAADCSFSKKHSLETLSSFLEKKLTHFHPPPVHWSAAAVQLFTVHQTDDGDVSVVVHCFRAITF